MPTAQPATTPRREFSRIKDLKRAAARRGYNEDGAIATTYRRTTNAWNVSSIATVKS